MNAIRTDWTIENVYDKSKIDLSNNVCVDQLLLYKLKELSLEFNPKYIFEYSNGFLAYSALSEYHSMSLNNICIGFGIGELLQRIYQIWANCRFAVYSPGWVPAELFLKVNGIKYVLTDKLDNDADIFYFANPNGVTGNIFSKEEILSIVTKYKLVIIDEAYMDFCIESQSLLSDSINYDNLIILKTFSKSVASPGLRFGYAVGHERIIQKIQEYRPATIISAFTEFLVPNLFSEIMPHVSRMLEVKKVIESNFHVRHSNGNFVLFESIPDILNQKVKFRETAQGLYRMSLIDSDTLKGLL